MPIFIWQGRNIAHLLKTCWALNTTAPCKTHLGQQEEHKGVTQLFNGKFIPSLHQIDLPW
jgi:hypothetical protein